MDGRDKPGHDAGEALVFHVRSSALIRNPNVDASRVIRQFVTSHGNWQFGIWLRRQPDVSKLN
ncbi:Hypothetical protein BN69_2523 [Methylocystis sp. SC2]|nr:Hypothetical protein BN69_2523 [Methylocystis sp. SC2]